MIEYALTTFDNPFDPFEQFDDWLNFDIEKGYYTSAYLARVCSAIEDDYKVEEYSDVIVEEAIDNIISCDFLDIYKKVTRNIKNNEG